jgi:hypothetical protein
MAVQDKYADTALAAGKKGSGMVTSGNNIVELVETVELAAADDDTSVFRFFKSVPSSYVPVEITITCDAITSGTDFDLGLYKVGVAGAVVDKDVLMDGQTLASALTRATGHQLGLAAVNIADARKTLGTLSAQTEIDPSYDICLTANTIGSAAGTVTIYAKFIQG